MNQVQWSMLFSFIQNWRRKQISKKPMPENWRRILEDKVLYYQRLPQDKQRLLENYIKIFIEEKNFEGCAGLLVTEEMKVIIAAYACVLLLGLKTNFYPNLYSILIYPTTFIAEAKTELPGGVVAEGQDFRLGETSNSGALVLAWDNVLHGISNPNDGDNVVFHEFAHQLDGESGTFDGTPNLHQLGQYRPWAKILAKEFKKLKAAHLKRKKTILDTYGATDEAEFFAVVTETFFEKPEKLKAKHPELFHLLSEYYQQDPNRYFR